MGLMVPSWKSAGHSVNHFGYRRGESVRRPETGAEQSPTDPHLPILPRVDLLVHDAAAAEFHTVGSESGRRPLTASTSEMTQQRKAARRGLLGYVPVGHLHLLGQHLLLKKI